MGGTRLILFPQGLSAAGPFLPFRGLHVNFDLLCRPAGGGVAVQVFRVDRLIWPHLERVVVRKHLIFLEISHLPAVGSLTLNADALINPTTQFVLLFPPFSPHIISDVITNNEQTQTLIRDENSFLDQLFPRLPGGDFPLQD